jgi:hypothetical protein
MYTPDHPSVAASLNHAGRFLAAALLPALVAGVQAADCDDGALSSPAVATYRGGLGLGPAFARTVEAGVGVRVGVGVGVRVGVGVGQFD